VNIRTARVATLGHEVVNVFYVDRLDASARDLLVAALQEELTASAP
jgi:UTP:GlnB (protein PII) uridylyltransferase